MLIVLGVVLVFIIAYFAVTERRKKLQEDSTILAEEVMDGYNEWLSEEGEEAKTELQEVLFDKIQTILRNYPNQYGAQRAYFIQANIYYEIGDWEKAAESFQKLAESFPKSYLSSLSLFNAGICQEGLQNFRTALRLYADVVDTYQTSHLVPHALFSIGRIQEELENFTEALSAYNRLEDDYGSSQWTQFAKNRIIALGVLEKIQE